LSFRSGHGHGLDREEELLAALVCRSPTHDMEALPRKMALYKGAEVASIHAR
jgi:hypothetical protein